MFLYLVLNVSSSLNGTWLQTELSLQLLSIGKLSPFESMSMWTGAEILILRYSQKELNIPSSILY